MKIHSRNTRGGDSPVNEKISLVHKNLRLDSLWQERYTKKYPSLSLSLSPFLPPSPPGRTRACTSLERLEGLGAAPLERAAAPGARKRKKRGRERGTGAGAGARKK